MKVWEVDTVVGARFSDDRAERRLAEQLPRGHVVADDLFCHGVEHAYCRHGPDCLRDLADSLVLIDVLDLPDSRERIVRVEGERAGSCARRGWHQAEDRSCSPLCNPFTCSHPT